jgi:hypothetical protein
MRELAIRFRALFDGAERGYGIYEVTGAKTPEGKRVGNAATKTGPVTLDLWESHLSGRTGIGIIPIKEDSTVKFGAIDIDVYDGLDHKKIAKILEKYDIRLVVTRSKSGGAHLWCFAKDWVPAVTMQRALANIAAFLGYGTAEIFPKQTKVLAERGDKGNWINMPYFGGLTGMRFAIRTDGEAMDFEEFLAYAEKIKVDEEGLNKPLQDKPIEDFIDGPPCLQHLAQLGVPEGTRNNGLFAIAVYLRKAFPSAWEDLLEEYNVKYMDPPLKNSEVQGTIKSAKKKDYAYPCSKAPIAQHCNSAVCRTRKFGIQGGSGAFPNLGILTMLDVRPPIWFWDVEGKRMELTTGELQDPNAFQKKCMEVIQMIPAVPSRIAWQRIVQDAMEKVVIIEASEDASPEGQFWEYVHKFCSGKAKALSLDEIIQGKPFEDEGGTVYFRIVDLEAFLDRQRFRKFETNKITALLRDKGAKHGAKKFKGQHTNYWYLKLQDQQNETFDVPESVKKGADVY